MKGGVGLAGWPCSGRFTHINGHPSAAWSSVQDGESSPVTDRRSTTVPRNQSTVRFIYVCNMQRQFHWKLAIIYHLLIIDRIIRLGSLERTYKTAVRLTGWSCRQLQRCRTDTEYHRPIRPKKPFRCSRSHTCNPTTTRTSIWLYKVAASVSVCVSVRDFSKTCRPISVKLFVVHRGHRQAWTEKNPENFDPLCVKIRKTLQNGRFRESPHGRRTLACPMACGPSSRARLRAGRWYDSGTGQSRAGVGAWPVAFHAGPSQTLLCSWVHFSGPTSRSAFGRVNANKILFSD